MTNRHVQAIAVAAAAAGGLLTAAFLQAAVAAADNESADTFTIGSLTFSDPVAMPGIFGGNPTPGFEHLTPLFATAPLMSLGMDKMLGALVMGSQQFDVADGSTKLGTVDAQTSIQDLLGIETAQYTVASTDPAKGLTSAQAAELPADGTVYSITKIGNGFYNIYEADPNSAGTAAASVKDSLVTPYGDVNLSSLFGSFDAIAPLDPASPLEALGKPSGITGLSDNAFTIDGTTFDPGKAGVSAAIMLPLSNFAPFMNFWASNLNITGTNPADISGSQNFEVYSGGTDQGSVSSSLYASDLLGFHTTEILVTADTPKDGAKDLPTVGTLYGVTDIAKGWTNIYEAVPAAGGTGASTITDTLMTPFGDVKVPTTFDAAAPMNVAGPFEALAATSGNAALSANAFTLEGLTFDPGKAGFDTTVTYPLFSVAPLLQISGVDALNQMQTTQHLEVYSGDTNLGSVTVGEGMSDLLGIDTTQLTVVSTDAAKGLTAAQAALLPADGTVYSVTDLAKGWTNVYEAIPNADGTAASHITDTLFTPFGDVDLSKMFGSFDAIAPLDAGDIVSGLDASGAAF